MSAEQNKNVAFIHGLWLHSSSWQPWVEYFKQAGYNAVTLDWPGDAPTVEEARQNPDAVAGKGIDEIVTYHAQQLKQFETPPILIGHSFGGLIVERLAAMGLASASVAIDPAPMKGVFILPLSALRVASIALRNPANKNHAVSLTEAEFRYGFCNALTPEESSDLYEKWSIPSPGRPLFEAAVANFSPHSPAKVVLDSPGRGPLLITGGGYDHTVPASVSQTSYKLESKSEALTDVHIFDSRGHSLTIDHGWQEVADYVLEWLKNRQ